MKRRGKLALVGTFTLAVALQLALLRTSQRVPDGDEAIVGLMALRIVNHGEHPLFFLGQTYDAGSGMLAHLVALLFTIDGVSAVSLKLAALFLWLLLALVVVVSLQRSFGRPAAWLGGALVLYSPTSVEWALKPRGGYWPATLTGVVTFALALEIVSRVPSEEARSQRWLALAAGFCAAAAAWFQPNALPLVTAAGGVAALFLMRRRDLVALLCLLGGAIAASVLPVWMLPGESVWSWRRFTGPGMEVHGILLLTRVLPGLFTPDLDWSIPPASPWIDGIGWLWTVGWVLASVALAARTLRRGLPDAERWKVRLLVVGTWSAGAAMFMVDSRVINPRTLLPLYPLACMAMAVAGAGWWRSERSRGAILAAGVALVLSGIAVHVAAIGPATIHGAGEQMTRVSGDLVAQILTDLERHNTQCVFSESPMLQWNLMFGSAERVAARWTSAHDRWQPYVDRVNAAYLRGERCALLLRTAGQERQVAAVHGERPQQLTLLSDGYALLYDPPRELITRYFARDGGWPPQ